MYELAPTNQWLTTKQELLDQAKEITIIRDDKDLDIAGTLDTQAKKLIKDLSAQRKSVTSQIDAVKKAIMNQEKDLIADIATEQSRLNKLCVDYATECERIRKEQQAALEAEQRKLAEQQATATIGEDYDPFAEPEPVEVVPQTIVPDSPKTSNNSFVKVIKFSIEDSNLIPREFLSVDESKIRAYIQFQKSQGGNADTITIPGIKVYEEISVRAK